MSVFRNMPIKWKLVITFMLTSCSTMVFSCAIFIANDLASFRDRLAMDISQVAQMIVENTKAPLAFGDYYAVDHSLSLLAATPHITSACIYGADDAIVAKYFSDGSISFPPPQKPERDGHHMEKGSLVLFQKIALAGKKVGTVYIQRDTLEIKARLKWYATTLAAILLAVFCMSALLSAKLKQVILSPIQDLARTTQIVSKDKNYEIRAKKQSEDEIGMLIDGFNEMLSQIQKRDMKLEMHRKRLEEQVATRTADLQRANEELRAEIVERLRAEKELERSKEAADSANRAKSEFLAGMSHEIRTPLNAILGMAELLGETAITPEQAEYVQIFNSAGESLLGIINDILDLSRIESGEMSLETIEFSLRDLLEKCCKVVAVSAHQKGLELVCRITPGVPSFVVGDPNWLRQVLFNLLGNAVKFTERGEIVVNVEPDSAEQEAGWLLFSIRDTGIGVLKEKQSYIFERFTQADSSINRRFGGTGLGLAISKKLLALMGGRIWVESEPDRGSCFFFSVKLGPSHTESHESALDPPFDPKIAGALVVDDNAAARGVLKEMLSEWGIGVRESADGKDALKWCANALANNESIDLALVDARMAEKDGFELARQIKASHANGIRVFVMFDSSYQQADLIKKRELGLDGFLIKPIFRSELQKAILSPRDGICVENIRATDNDLNSFSILLVEDNLNNIKLIEHYLKKVSCRIDIAGNGRQAVSKFCSGTYRLVLMDIEMPIMNGYEATRAIREWEEKMNVQPTSIVALTAHAFKEDRQKCIEAGCTDYMVKPVSKNSLMAVISALAEKVGHDTGEMEARLTGSADGNGCRARPQEEYVVRVGAELDYLIPSYLEDTQKDLAVMERALEGGDFEVVRRIGHSTKGTAGGYGFPRLAEMGLSIELAAKGKNSDEIRRLLKTCSDYIERIRVEYV